MKHSSMKKISLFAVCVLLVTSMVALPGCSDEDKPDPELVKARDAQRQAMDPSNGRGNTPDQNGQAPGVTNSR